MRPTTTTLYAAGLLFTGCVGDGPPARKGANAEAYIRALCEDVCAKFDECAPVPESFGECLVSECMDSVSYDESCLPERVETKRCWIERESCEEYFDPFVDTTPESVCYDIYIAWVECEARAIGD